MGGGEPSGPWSKGGGTGGAGRLSSAFNLEPTLAGRGREGGDGRREGKRSREGREREGRRERVEKGRKRMGLQGREEKVRGE